MNAKGLGALQTYWLDAALKRDHANNSENGDNTERGIERDAKKYEETKQERLIDWMTEVFTGYVKKIVRENISFRSLP